MGPISNPPDAIELQRSPISYDVRVTRRNFLVTTVVLKSDWIDTSRLTSTSLLLETRDLSCKEGCREED
jgi:hypothetical protein